MTIKYLLTLLSTLMTLAFSGAVIILMIGCTSTAHLTSALDEAGREREVLRVAYEAQQLRLREVEAQLVRLNDQVTFTPPPSSRADRGRSIDELPVIQLQRRGRGRPVNSAQNTSRSRTIAIRRSPQPQLEPTFPDRRRRDSEALPTLTQENIEQFTPLDRRKKAKKKRNTRNMMPVAPPENAAYAPDLNISPVPPPPSTSPATKRAQKRPSSPPQKANLEHEPSQPLKRLARSEAVFPDQVIRSKPIDHRANLLVEADRLRYAQDCKSAQKKYQMFLSRASQHSKQPDALYGLALCHQALGSLTIALNQMRALIQQFPTHKQISNVLLSIGLIQIQQGKRSEGIATLTRLERLYPKTSAALRAHRNLEALRGAP